MTNHALELPVTTQPKSNTRAQRTRAQWKSVVDDFASSGLTKTAFCRKRGIATSCLYRWQKVFAGQLASGNFIDITEPVSSAPSASPRTDGNPHWQVELELGAGMVLRLRSR